MGLASVVAIHSEDRKNEGAGSRYRLPEVSRN